MLLSKTCEYAIRALIFIAQRSREEQRAGIKEIARAIDSPEHFIAKILQDLGRKGFVQSVKGPNGGFFLDARSAKHTLADIVREIDGDKLFTGCGLGLAQCSEKHPCPLHNDFKVIRERIRTMLEKATLNELTVELRKKHTYLKLT